MKINDLIKLPIETVAKKAIKKSSPYGMGGSFPAFVDQYRRQRAPSPQNLVEEYEEVAYTCANLNATTVASTPLRLFLQSSKGQTNRFWPTKSVCKYERDVLRKRLSLTSDHKLEEVLNHPVLDFLHNPNDHLDMFSLLEFTQLFEEIVGTAYWRITKDTLGRPQDVECLHSQFVVVNRDIYGRPLSYDYCGQTYELDEIISFPMPNLMDPFVGYSPLRAVWEQVNVANKLDATQARMLDNDASPSMVVSPSGDDAFMGDDTRERYEMRWRQKFAQGAGGPIFTDEPVDIKQLSFSPRDLSALQIKAVTKSSIANAFGVPMALLETKDVNRANLEGSRLMHAQNAILPRVRRMEARLNKFLVSLYDPSGRLFLAFDDPSPENRQEKQAELAGYVAQNIITRNEARNEIGLEPHEDGDGLFPIQPGMQGLVSGKAEGQPVVEEKPEAPAEATAAPVADVQQTALNGAQVSSLLEIATQVGLGQLPIETARALIAAAFPGLSDQQVNAIIGPLDGFKPQQPEAPATPAAKPQAQPEVDPEPEPEEQPEDEAVDEDKPEPKGKSFNLPVINKAMEFGLPDGKELQEVVASFFKKKRLQILGSIEKGYTKKSLPSAFVGLDDWTDELGTACKPLIELYLSESAKELLARVGASPEMFDVTSPYIQEAVAKAVYAFSQSTIDSTSKELNSALAKLRENLAAGLVSEDNRLSDLTKTVNGIFENLSEDRAFQIATTEASRAHHLGAQIGAEASGVVKGKRWLLSTAACDECKALAAKYPNGVGLKESFGTREASREEYRDLPYPPMHVRCRCACEFVTDAEE